MSEGKFGVIVCPNCQNAKAVDLSTKTSQCSHCGKKLKISKLRLYYEADTREEATWAIGRINAELSGRKMPDEKVKEKDPYTKALDAAQHGSNLRSKLELMAASLTESMGEFELDDIRTIAERGDLGEYEELVEKIRKLDEVYEPEEGVFRAV